MAGGLAFGKSMRRSMRDRLYTNIYSKDLKTDNHLFGCGLLASTPAASGFVFNCLPSEIAEVTPSPDQTLH